MRVVLKDRAVARSYRVLRQQGGFAQNGIHQGSLR